jgi:hypothetical protein
MNELAYYDFIMHLTAGIAFTLISIAILFFANRTKVEKQRTLQKLIENGRDITPELLEELGLKKKRRPQDDFRKGVLLLVTGMILTATFKLIGGILWIFGFLPMIIGLIYIAFSRVKLAK